MQQIFSVNVEDVGSYSAIWVKVSYEKKRVGTTQQYKFQFQQYLSNRSGSPSSGATYDNPVRNRFYLNGYMVWEWTKPQYGGRDWSYTQTTDWLSVENKTSGTTPFYFTCKDTINKNWTDYTSSIYQLPIDDAGNILNCPTLYNTVFNTTTSNYNAQLQIIQPTATNDFYIFGNQTEYDNFIGGNLTSYTKRIQNVTEDFTFNFSANEINHIASLNTTKSNDFDIKLLNITYEDSSRTNEIMKSIVDGTMNMSGLEPTITSSIFNDTTTQTITGNTSTTCSNFVKGKTKINVSYTINLKGGATIVSASIGGTNVQTTNNIVSLNNIMQNNLSLNIIDSRGNVLTYSKVLALKNYFEIGYEGLSKRNSPTNDRIDIILNGQFWNNNFGATNNTLTIKYKIWEKGTNEPTSWTGTLTPTITQNNFIINYTTDPIYDYRKIYQLKVLIEDKVMAIYPQKTISKGTPVFWWTEDDFHIGTNDTQSKLFLNGQEITSQPTITPSQTIDSSTTDIPSNNAVKTFVEGFGTIQEMNSNSNGTYIKYTNGLLICIKTVSIGANNNNNVYFGSGSGRWCYTNSMGNWAHTFTNIWGAWFSQTQGIGANNAMWQPTYYYDWNTTSCGRIGGARDSTGTGQSITARLLAIGTWK